MCVRYSFSMFWSIGGISLAHWEARMPLCECFFFMMDTACLISTTLFDKISGDGISVPSWCGEVPGYHDFWLVKDMPNAVGALWRSCLTVTVLCHSTWMTWRGRTSASSSASTSWRRGYSRSMRRAVRMSTGRWVAGMQRAMTSVCPWVWSVCVCVYVKSGLSEALIRKTAGQTVSLLPWGFCHSVSGIQLGFVRCLTRYVQYADTWSWKLAPLCNF